MTIHYINVSINYRNGYSGNADSSTEITNGGSTTVQQPLVRMVANSHESYSRTRENIIIYTCTCTCIIIIIRDALI